MSFKSKMRRLGQHPLLQVLSNNKGNPRTLVLIEPLWGIPYNLIAPFATLYMYTQGVTDVQIGLILSITMFVQVFFSFFGGILADKLGLSEKQLMHVTNSEPGSGLILFDNVVIPFVDKYPADTKTFAIMNTKPEESVTKEDEES